MSAWTTERARVASLSRSRLEDDPDLVAARQNLKAMRLEDAAAEIAAKAIAYPPLNTQQRDAVLAAFAGFTPTRGGDAS